MNINNLNRFFNSLFLLSNFFIFSSCQKHYIIKDFNNYTTTQIKKTEFMPSNAELASGQKDVVAFEFDVPDSAREYKNDLSIYSKSVIENILSEMKWVNILDRKLFNKTKDELKLAELDNRPSKSISTELKKADYIIYGSITNLAFSGEDVGVPLINYIGYVGLLALSIGAFIGSRAGVAIFIWPKLESYYKYRIKLEGNIKIIDTNNNMTFKTLKFSESKTWKEANSGNQMKNYDSINVNSMIESAIKSKKNEIANIIPITGYIAERRDADNDNNPLIRINRGSNFGIEEGMKFICEDKFKTIDQLNSIESIESKKISGFISDQITEKDSWMVISKKEIDFLKIGDYCYIIN